jgi:hypothetical protein
MYVGLRRASLLLCQGVHHFGHLVSYINASTYSASSQLICKWLSLQSV